MDTTYNSLLSDIEFTKCIALGAGYDIGKIAGAKFYQLLHSRATRFYMCCTKIGSSAIRSWTLSMPEEQLIYILRRNKYALPNEIIYITASTQHSINSQKCIYPVNLYNSPIVELLIERGCFPPAFYVCDTIMNSDIFAQFYDIDFGDNTVTYQKYYIYKFNVLLRALQNTPHDEIVHKHAFWESEISPDWRALARESQANILNKIESQYIDRLYELYPAILFVRHRPSNLSLDMQITIPEFRRILSFSADTMYYDHICKHLMKYFGDILLMALAKTECDAATNYLRDVSRVIFDDYPRYISAAIFQDFQTSEARIKYISYMPTFYRDTTEKGLLEFIKNNIERCPNLHKFVLKFSISREVIIRILQNYPIPNNPIAKNIDALTSSIMRRGYGHTRDELHFNLLRDKSILCTNFKSPTHPYSRNTISVRADDSAADTQTAFIARYIGNINNFRRTLAECVAEEPQILPYIDPSGSDITNNLLDLSGAVNRLKVEYIYGMTDLAIDIRHMIAHNFIHRDNNGADDFERYLRITSTI
jgi:hypothetical protein